ncbi:hypothetical protein QFC19_000528 [Naganishia cerealis]|uniref:Uncharacterized protein n=1 Tax=Naganishia cerealis TaxID=610337 RepID=A0ACC2WND5_9TREE|nr:hypothetical protein QFC19_000528 [Naganishia cerealis]
MLKQTSRRWYSTGGDNSMFLSDLLTRIDKITANTKKIVEPRKDANKMQSKSNRLNKTGDKQKNTGSNMKPKGQKAASGAQGAPQSVVRRQKVQVADHPMAYQAFNALKESGPKHSGPRQNRSSAPRGTSQHNSRSPRTSRTSGSENSGQRRPQRVTSRQRSPVVAKPLKSKTVSSGPLVPQLSGETFLYGKVTSVSANLSSRVAAVTKEALIKSQYPYKLPKSIIQNLDDAPKNKYLAQANYNTDVDAEKLATRINEVVRGQVTELNGSLDHLKSPEEIRMAEFAKAQLMKNGDLDLPSKTLIYNIASGLQSPKSLMEGKHWVK